MIVIAICRESRVLRLLSFLAFSSAVPPLADTDLKFELGMAVGIDRVCFHAHLGRNYHRDARETIVPSYKSLYAGVDGAGGVGPIDAESVTRV